MFRYNLLFIVFAVLIFNSFAQSGKESNGILTEWTLVDTMQNSFGPASSLLNPIAYDNWSDALILVHRGADTYAQSSGEIWYNMSTDLGTTWTRISAINTSIITDSRYPSAAILNPNNGGLDGTAGVFVWTDISNPAGFGYDEPLGGGSPQAVYDSLFSSIITWTDDQWAFWAGGTVSGYSIARTNDLSVIEHYQVLDNSVSVIGLGCVGLNGKEYLGFIGTFPDPDPGNPIYSGFYPAYSKSTDYGQTWSSAQVVDFRTIPSLNNYDMLFDYIKNDPFFSYTGDINVDQNGYVHLILSVTDTTTNNSTGFNALVEVYETSDGWDGKVIFEGISDNAFTIHEGPAIGQMGPCGYLAFDKDRNQMACVWVSDSPSSSLGSCDVYISWRNLSSDNWSQPINLTQTDDMNENGIHLAPLLHSDLKSTYKAFVGYFYELDYYGPDPDIYDKTGFWVTSVNQTSTGIGISDNGVKGFYLDQNYPNPFNPTTSIQYSVGSLPDGKAGLQFLTLKVYDVLGNEVATLVNEEKSAGGYTVEFNGDKYSSGVYFYKLQSGNFLQVRKMLLLK